MTTLLYILAILALIAQSANAATWEVEVTGEISRKVEQYRPDSSPVPIFLTGVQPEVEWFCIANGIVKSNSPEGDPMESVGIECHPFAQPVPPGFLGVAKATSVRGTHMCMPSIFHLLSGKKNAEGKEISVSIVVRCKEGMVWGKGVTE